MSTPPSIHAKIFIIICVSTLGIALSVPATENAIHSSPDTEKQFSYIGLPTLVVIGVTTLGYWLTPMSEWQSDIQKLTEDEMFIKRWIMFNEDPATLEKAQRELERIQKEKRAKQKKLRRLQKWAYPLITVIGAGAMMLTFWLRGE